MKRALATCLLFTALPLTAQRVDRAYTVQKGDTLWEISTTQGATAQQVLGRANEIGAANGYAPIGQPLEGRKDPHHLFEGEVLRIPGEDEQAYRNLWRRCEFYLHEDPKDRARVEPSNDAWSDADLGILVQWDPRHPEKLDVYHEGEIAQHMPLPQGTRRAALLRSSTEPLHHLQSFRDVTAHYERTDQDGRVICGTRHYRLEEGQSYALDLDLELIK